MRYISNILVSGFISMALLVIFNCDAFQATRLKRSTEEACLKKPDSGMCLALFIKWYYNSTEETCNKFVYGGCGGNDNRFDTGEECVSTCGGTVVESDSDTAPVFPPESDEFLSNNDDRCDSNAETGPCKAIIIRYYFDGKECKTFQYGGCQGNNNNFETEEECLSACGHKISNGFQAARLKRSIEEACLKKPVTGMCYARFINWYYNSNEETCNKFVYGGCGGNDNNFDTGEECVSTCGGTVVESDSDSAPVFPSDSDEFLSDNDDWCDSAAETGPCKANITRYYFDGKECKTFQYGGCQGNNNNFETEEECLSACGHKISTEETDG